MFTILNEAQEALVRRVREGITEPAVSAELDRVRFAAGREPDVRPLYRELGRRGLLAPGWPREYGGSGMSQCDGAQAIAELHRAGVPDMLHALSIQIVGGCLLLAGSPEQKAGYLPDLARGERFGIVLYSEPDAGSDLAALATVAVREPDGYRIRGRKVFSLKGSVADLALVLARTSTGASRYHGLSLFLVDLDRPQVRRETRASVADEQFDEYELDDVRVPLAALIGEEGQAWPLLSAFLVTERTGLDYSLRAERWWRAAAAGLTDARRDAVADEVGRYATGAAVGQLFAGAVLAGVDRGEPDEAAAASAKFYSSETAHEIAVWASGLHGPEYHRHPDRGVASILEAAYREAPGLTVAAGASEVMLHLVASSGLEVRPSSAAATGDFSGDPLAEELRRALGGRLDAVAGDAGAEVVEAAVATCGGWRLEAPADVDGLDLGILTGIVVSEELGRRALPDVYGPVALAGDLLTAARDTSGLRTTLADFAARAGMTGFDAVAADDPSELPVARAGRLFERVTVPDPGTDLRCTPALRGADLAVVLVGRPAESAGGVNSTPVLAEIDVAPGGPLASARLRQAAYLLGLAAGAHGLATEHLNTRRQFGARLVDLPVAAAQAARCAIVIRATQLAVYRAGALSADPDRFDHAAQAALALATECVTSVVATAVHLHGARGLLRRSPVHRHFLRLREAVAVHGPARPLWRQVGRGQLCTVPPLRGHNGGTDHAVLFAPAPDRFPGALARGTGVPW